MLEALACGLPIVSTHLAAFGINPVLGKEMFLTDDYDRFAEYVIRLLRDEGLRRQMSAMARALGERFDHRNAAKKLDQTLKS
jgi:glycosyltransferase involved in cell wall biosynthesis